MDVLRINSGLDLEPGGIMKICYLISTREVGLLYALERTDSRGLMSNSY